jgi:hypothetical protein
MCGEGTRVKRADRTSETVTISYIGVTSFDARGQIMNSAFVLQSRIQFLILDIDHVVAIKKHDPVFIIPSKKVVHIWVLNMKSFIVYSTNGT